MYHFTQHHHHIKYTINKSNYLLIINEHQLKLHSTAYFSDARALLLTERVIVLCVYAAHACSFNY